MRTLVAVSALLAACADGPPPSPFSPDTTAAIQKEAAARLTPVARPPLGSAGAPGDAAVDHAVVAAGLGTLPPTLDAAARATYGRFAVSSSPGALPDGVATAARGPAAAAIAATLATAAGRDHVRSPFATAITPEGRLAFLEIADLAALVARARFELAAPGEAAAGARLLLDVARYGQDQTRRSHLAGHGVGLAVEARALSALTAGLARLPADRLTDAERADLADRYRRLLADQPTLRDALVDEAGFLLVSLGAAGRLNLGFPPEGLLRFEPETLDGLGGVASAADRAARLLAAYRALPAAPPDALAAAAERACHEALGRFDGCRSHATLVAILARDLAVIRAVPL